MDRETLEIVRAFVAESLDSLDEQEGKIQGLTEAGGKESIHSIFRVFHTIKGLSGFLSFNTLNTVTHEAETLLDLLRNKPDVITEGVIDVIYESFDVLRTLLNNVASVLKDTGNEEMVRKLISRLQQAIIAIKSGNPVEITAKRTATPTATPLPTSSSPTTTENADVFANLDTAHLSEEELDTYMAQVFDQEASTQTSLDGQNVPYLTAEKTERKNFNQTTDQNIDQSTSPFFFSADELASLEGQEERDISSASAADTHADSPSSLVASIPPDILQRYITEALELVATAENGCLGLEQNPHDMTLVGSIFGAVHSLKGNSGFMGFAEIEGMSMDLENILDAVRSRTLEVYPGLISMLLTNIDIVKSAVQDLAAAQNMTVIHVQSNSRNLPEPDLVLQTQPVSVEPAPTLRVGDSEAPITPQEPKESSSTTEAIPAALQRRDIRVDMDKLDKLFDLVGELITIESMVTNNPEVQAMELENFNRAAGMLNKITRELQEVTLSIRMMPLEGLFSKMKRLVRDVSLRIDKKITLEIAGAETEMDKNVIEEVSDPLMHIIRNAIDHGIESRERRLAAGKSEIGTVKLQARYEGNEILIVVEDDGGGINRAKVIEKAMSKGLLKTSPEKMTDREVNALIFEPGFSTADKITDISGRGVGMDVVKRNIEKLQGSITIDTREGKGSRFTLRIPLTLAIMDAMLIRVGSSVYALPILSIRESFRPQPEAITITMDGLEVVRVREELFSVIRLHEMHHRSPDTTNLCEGILVIVESREKKACLFVDEILGQQQIVVKSLSDYVGNVDGITGCMIQSNGEVGLIIDVEMLLQMSVGDSALQALV